MAFIVSSILKTLMLLCITKLKVLIASCFQKISQVEWVNQGFQCTIKMPKGGFVMWLLLTKYSWCILFFWSLYLTLLLCYKLQHLGITWIWFLNSIRRICYLFLNGAQGQAEGRNAIKLTQTNLNFFYINLLILLTEN